jgi:hypothetical protein
MASYGLIPMLLVLVACRGSALPATDRESGLSALGQYPDLDRDLRAYANGREAEIETLERWLAQTDPIRSGALDSIGAVAADLRLERYVRLAGDVDSALVRWREDGKLDQRLRRLDSLRVERRVLLVRLKTKEIGGDR